MPKILSNDDAYDIQFSAARPSGDWRVDHEVLLEVERLLGLTHHIRIWRVGGSHTYGAYRYKDQQHWITIQTHLDTEEANKTFWHELVHAQQKERQLSDPSVMTFRQQRKIYRYEDRPYEHEANRVSEAYSDKLKVIVDA